MDVSLKTGSGMLSPDEALTIILDSVDKLGAENISLQCALGRVLAENIVAGEDLPPFDNSAMDGYAVIAADTASASEKAPTLLKVIAHEPAGTITSKRLTPGNAIKIMTGAPMPDGADTVVMAEDTILCNGSVAICGAVSVGANVRRSGEDVKQDKVVIPEGTKIGAAEMGMLAALGRTEIKVYARPKIAIITTGNEIVDASETPGPGQIRNSNLYSLLGQALKADAEVTLLQSIRDECEELSRAIKYAAEVSDVIITSGGVSIGDYDFVKQTLAEIGDVVFWKVAMKPGKPLAFGQVMGKPLFGLPGNPVSSMVTFDLFVRPALHKMSGVRKLSRMQVQGIILQDIKHKEGRREFVRASAIWNGSEYEAVPTGDQSSGRISSMLNANCYVVVSEDRGNLKAGERVDILFID